MIVFYKIFTLSHLALAAIIEMIKVYYVFISPYLQIAFATALAHYFVIQKIITQKKQDRTSDVLKQKDALNKEVFDVISKKTESAYQSLGEVKTYCFIFQKINLTPLSILKGSLEEFIECHIQLHKEITLIFITCEKYDFIFSYQQQQMMLLSLQAELSEICFQIEKLGFKLLENKLTKDHPKEIYGQFHLEIERLSEVCSKINLHLQQISDSSKVLLKNIFNSVEAQAK